MAKDSSRVVARGRVEMQELGEPIEAGELLSPLTFFLTRDERKAVLKKLGCKSSERAAQLCKALGVKSVAVKKAEK